MTDYGFHLQTEEDLRPRRPSCVEVDPNERIPFTPQPGDDPTGARRGRAGAISVIVHIVVIVFLIFEAKLFQSGPIDLHKQAPPRNRVLTYLAEPAIEPRPAMKPPVLTK